jgi:hypothetical protein
LPPSWSALLVIASASGLVAFAPPVTAASRTIELHFTPAAHLQLALWIESTDGTFLKTVGVTQAVSYRGIGNRPGSSQMNSGFRWPYGRREGVLPVWAHRRAAAPGAVPWKRVVFQQRVEGHASRDIPADSSLDSYFCLSFTEHTGAVDQSTREKALDAVTCASGFMSDKGRFITQADVDGGYWEPIEVLGAPVRRALDLWSLYPPRRDAHQCSGTPVCFDLPDVDSYDQHAREVMPDIDAVTMATPGEADQSVMFDVPEEWPDGAYVAWIEASKEGDYNDSFNDQTYPTPRKPPAAWDTPWATDYGYAYRGQPSVVYRVDFTVGGTGTFTTAAPVGRGDLDGFGPTGGDLTAIAGALITDDPVAAPGSGADRLRRTTDGVRVRLEVRNCPPHEPPGGPVTLSARADPDSKHSHEWGVLRFVEPAGSQPIDHYEARFGPSAIVPGDESLFLRATPLVTADLDPVAARIGGGTPGQAVEVHFGGMLPTTTFWVAVRAVDACGMHGPVEVAQLTTSKVNFTKLSGCFIATAAFGSALGPEVQSLRTVRDALRPRSTVFATVTDLYYRSGPAAAAVIERSEGARAVVRNLLGPVVALARAAAPALEGRGNGAIIPAP